MVLNETSNQQYESDILHIIRMINIDICIGDDVIIVGVLDGGGGVGVGVSVGVGINVG